MTGASWNIPKGELRMRIFFEPLEFDLEPADLGVEFVGDRPRLGLRPSVFEQLDRPFDERLLPRRN